MEKLTTKDKKLIYTLDFNARMPLSKLAKKIGVSKQVCKYRLDKLKDSNIIQGFYTDINTSKIGLSIYLIYLQFHNLTPKLEKEFINHISKQEGVGVNSSLNGKWNHCIGIWAESIIHFKNYYKKIIKNYEKYIKNKTIMIETDFYYFKPKQILDKKEGKQVIMTGDIKSFKIDKIDKILLITLSKNARISLIDLSKKIKLTPNAIKLRIKNLEKNNIILGYRVMINYTLLKFLHYRVFLHIENNTEETEKKLINFLRFHKTVVSVTKTIGYCELEFRTIVRDIYEFYSLLEKLRNEFPETIKGYESVLYYKFYETLNYFPFSKS